MDQLILPEGVQSYITVPYKCAEPWDGGDFMTYPERKGWSKDLADHALGGRTPAEIDAFLQTWLFFGCVIEVLKTGGVQVSENDFIDRSNGTRTVTTKKLPGFLVEWRKLWPGEKDVSPECRCRSYQVNNPKRRCGADRCWQSVVRDRNGDALRLSQRILDEVRKFADQICLHGTEAVDLNEKKRNTMLQRSVQPEIALSISALGFTLRTAIQKIYDTPPGYEHWETPTFIKHRLLEANWCPSRVAEIFKAVGIDGRYYCAANPTGEDLDHSACDERGCVARNVNEQTYVTRHTPDCQGCEHVEVPENDLLLLVHSGEIPLITWIESEGRLTITKATLDSTSKPEPSTLLALPGLNNNSESGEGMTVQSNTYVAISHVWSDGLGNAYNNSLPTCQLSRIQKMVDDLFPKRAHDAHIPFWMDTLCISVHDDGHRELSITKMRDIYEHSAASLVLDSGMEQLPLSAPIQERCLRFFNSGWQHRVWTFQEGMLPPRMFLRFQDKSLLLGDLVDERMKFEKHMENQGIYVPWVAMTEGVVTIHFMLLKGAVSMIVSGKDKDEHPRRTLYLPMSDAFSRRQATRASDEALCLTTVLGIDPSPFLAIKKDKDIVDKDIVGRRMELLLTYIGKFHKGIIFNARPRLRKEGYRWAPRSLMGSKSGELGELLDRDPRGSDDVCMVPIGSSHCLVGSYPGVHLESVPAAGLESDFIIIVNGSHQTRRYHVRLLLDESADFAGWDKSAEYSLITYKKLGNDVPDSIAVLGKQRKLEKDAAGVCVRYECRALVELLLDDARKGPEVGGKIVDGDERWNIM